MIIYLIIFIITNSSFSDHFIYLSGDSIDGDEDDYVLEKVEMDDDVDDGASLLYRTKHCSKKYYPHIAFHPISLAAINAFAMSHEIRGNGSLVDFLVDICWCLLIS